MLKKTLLVMLLALQFTAVTSIAAQDGPSDPGTMDPGFDIPIPPCYPCGR